MAEPRLDQFRAGLPEASAETTGRARLRLEGAIAAEQAVEPARSRRPRRRALVVGLAALVVSVIAALVMVSNDSPLTAREALARAAEIAGKEAAQRPRFVVEDSVVIGTRADPPPYSVYYPSRVIREVNPDRSGTITTYDGHPAFVGPRDEARWRATGKSPIAPPREEPEITRVRAGGGFPTTERLQRPTAALPTEPGELRRVLRNEFHGDVPLDVSIFNKAASILGDPTASPALRRAVYILLSETEGVELLGDRIDLAGRRGTAIALRYGYTGGRKENILIFDPRTTQLLQTETRLLSPSPYMDGSLESYSVIRSYDKEPATLPPPIEPPGIPAPTEVWERGPR